MYNALCVFSDLGYQHTLSRLTVDNTRALAICPTRVAQRIQNFWVCLPIGAMGINDPIWIERNVIAVYCYRPVRVYERTRMVHR